MSSIGGIRFLHGLGELAADDGADLGIPVRDQTNPPDFVADVPAFDPVRFRMTPLGADLAPAGFRAAVAVLDPGRRLLGAALAVANGDHRLAIQFAAERHVLVDADLMIVVAVSVGQQSLPLRRSQRRPLIHRQQTVLPAVILGKTAARPAEATRLERLQQVHHVPAQAVKVIGRHQGRGTDPDTPLRLADDLDPRVCLRRRRHKLAVQELPVSGRGHHCLFKHDPRLRRIPDPHPDAMLFLRLRPEPESILRVLAEGQPLGGVGRCRRRPRVEPSGCRHKPSRRLFAPLRLRSSWVSSVKGNALQRIKTTPTCEPVEITDPFCESRFQISL